MLGTIPARQKFIQEYDLNFLRSSFAKTYPQYASRFDECARELKRLFEIALFATEPLEVASIAVDKLWDEFARHKAYDDLCIRAYGKYLNVRPSGPDYKPGGRPAKALYKLYKQHFGQVPEIWYEDVPALAQ